MAEETKVTLDELVVSTLAMTDALAELMIAKGGKADAENDLIPKKLRGCVGPASCLAPYTSQKSC